MKLRMKVLVAFVILSVIPLSFIVYYSSINLKRMEGFLRMNTAEALDSMASASLVLRAEMVAGQVEQFLTSVESDLKELALLPVDSETYKIFSDINKGNVWFLDGDFERRVDLRLYSEAAFIRADGQEAVKIKNGRISENLLNVSDISNTKYLSEDYFIKASEMKDGEIYVGRVTGFHTDKITATPEYYGIKYRGHIRFAMPVFKEGTLKGVVSLALDHRHLMEFTQHITPMQEKYVVFPSYSSGNYSFMFDDEGWIITHPKHWDIRGVDREGRLVPPYTAESTEEEIERGTIPYNLIKAGFIHENYPVAANETSLGLSGVVDVTNVGGSQKIMAYAPIKYSSGVYADSGIFGGVTIGAEVRRFHEPAYKIAVVIGSELKKFVKSAWVLVCVIFAVVLFVSYRLAHGITEPLHKLFLVTKDMARGDMTAKVEVHSSDEVGQLAQSFNTMARELESRRAKLVSSLEELKESKASLMKEESFKTTVFENIESGIITVDQYNVISFINTPAREILGIESDVFRLELCEMLKERWPELAESLAEAFIEDEKWHRYVEMERGGRRLTFRLSVLPLCYESLHGRIITVEDLTERVNMREQIGRMDRLASMGRLSAGLAHEIRNPLTGVSMMLDDLHDRMIGRIDDQQLIQRSLQEIERLESLVNELLSFAADQGSKLGMGKLTGVIEDIRFLIQKQCERQGIKLRVELEDTGEFPMDKSRLKQAFLNIITNAIDAMPEGGELYIKACKREGSVCLHFRDTGEGVHKERLPFIFEPFYTTKGEGSGLGLAITHNIITDHKAEIKVDSSTAGTEFIIVFKP